MLAETLYRAGDLAAARERYYTVIELDEDHLEARASLACVLAEQGDVELATAALEGVLKQQPEYADAHWHLAGIHMEAGCEKKAEHHLLRFLSLAPESPWANLAREKLSQSSPDSGQDMID
jgi:Tfp pilus assembly protein PilF